MSYAIRPARLDDVPNLGPVEVRASELFRTVGLDDMAGNFMDPAMAASFVRQGGAFVAVDEADTVVGFTLNAPLDLAGHTYEISVDPAHGRQGLGGKLLAAAAAWSRDKGLTHMTLSTFADVAWNAPFYARHGYAIVPREKWTPGFFVLHEREKDAGLPMERRCFMRKDFAGGTNTA